MSAPGMSAVTAQNACPRQLPSPDNPMQASCRLIQLTDIVTIVAAGPYVSTYLPTCHQTEHTLPDNQVNQTKPIQQSQAVRANGQIFVSGQIPADSSANLVDGTIGEKTQACCDNIKAILEAANSNVQKIVKVNVCFFFGQYLLDWPGTGRGGRLVKVSVVVRG